MRLILYFALLLCLTAGCSRKTYRLWADRDARCLIESRQTNPENQIPNRSVEPPQQSRMHDFNDPDCPWERPCDDANAACYMECSYCYRGSKYWDQFSEGGAIEQMHWSEYLSVDESGECKVDRERSVQLALLHNRDYQTTYESLYLNALDLSLNRYDFHSRWFGRSGSSFDATGDGMAASRLLGIDNSLGFNRNFVGGGQFLANLTNSFVWQLGGGPNTNAISSNLVFMITQPFLRGAFRHVRMENLTQAERSLLYAVRDFVRFRRQFYLDTVSQYLRLLTTVQALKNQRANLNALELNLRETEELALRDQASLLQVDQVLQEYQGGRLAVLSAEQSLQDALDNFKFALGLPPESPIVLDETLLGTFELNDPRFDQLRIDAEEVYDRLRQYLPPEKAPSELLGSVAEDTIPLITSAQELLPEIQDELDRWEEKLEEESNTDSVDPDTKLDLRQQTNLFKRISNSLNELEIELVDDLELAEKYADEMDDMGAIENWRRLQTLLGGRVQNRIASMFVLQNQIRLFLIELQPFDIATDFAVDMAMCNRLDLRNQRAVVTDAFRQVELQADNLQSDFNVTASANLATDPTRANPLRFDSSAASYQLGIQFDGPLDRFAERNQYRAAQIAFQNSRRNFMGLEDSVKNSLRAAVRQLKINRLNFQIIRQQLISVTRRVDEAQINLRAPADNNVSTSRTRDLLEALQDLLDARNGLIQSWIDYEISRITLFVEMEMLFLDNSGVWVNERYNPKQDRVAEEANEQLDDGIKFIEPDPEAASENVEVDEDGDPNLDYFEGLPEPDNANS